MNDMNEQVDDKQAGSAPGEMKDMPDAAGRAQSWATIAVVLVLVLGCVALLFAMR